MALQRSLLCDVGGPLDQSAQQVTVALSDLQALIMARRQTSEAAAMSHPVQRNAASGGAPPSFFNGNSFPGSIVSPRAFGLGFDAMPIPQLSMGSMGTPLTNDAPHQQQQIGILASLAASLGPSGSTQSQQQFGSGLKGQATASALLAAAALEQQREEAAASVLASLANPLACDKAAANGKRSATGWNLDQPIKRQQYDR